MPYVYQRPYVYYFCQIFQALRLFPALRLLQTLEYVILSSSSRMARNKSGVSVATMGLAVIYEQYFWKKCCLWKALSYVITIKRPHRIATRQPHGFMSQPALCYNLLCDHGREIETFSANFSQFIALVCFSSLLTACLVKYFWNKTMVQFICNLFVVWPCPKWCTNPIAIFPHCVMGLPYSDH